MEKAGGRWHPRELNGWRRLGVFWLAVFSLIAIGSGILQLLGPPGPSPSIAARAKPSVTVAAGSASDHRTVVLTSRPRSVTAAGAGRDTPGPVTDPDPALLEQVDGSTQNLPRIAPDGRAPMNVYAAGFDHSSRRPRVALLLAGIGPNTAESDAAIRTLPGAVSLAVSPYAANAARLLATARTAGHEYVIELPLEPTGFPLNDPGPETLLTGGSPAANADKLHWALSRIDGYVGATGVIGTMRGERLAAMTDQMDAVLSDLSARGLLYIDPREDHGGVAKAWGRHVDLVVDDPANRDVADRTMIDAKLAALEQLAKDTGSALGMVMQPTPVAVARIAAWTNGLADRGLALAPVSAVVLPPPDGSAKMTEREQ